MFRLSAELFVCASVGLLACLYVRDRAKALRAQCIEWLRQQRIVTATQIAGPMATHNSPPLPAAAPVTERGTTPPADVVTPVPSIFHTLDYTRLEVPTYLRRGGAIPVSAKSPPQSHVPCPPAIGDEELIGYVYP